MNSKFNDHKFWISVGRRDNLINCVNQHLTWRDFCRLVQKPFVSQENHSFFLSRDKEEQTNLKQEAGWIIAGKVADGMRRNKDVVARSLISIDCDDISQELFASIKSGSNPLCGFEFVAHTTRKHTTENPRLRIFIPTQKPIEPHKYGAVSRIVAEMIDPTMESIDLISFTIGQLMFKPTCSKDKTAEFNCFVNNGDLLNHESVLDGWSGDWRDHGTHPRAKNSARPRVVGQEPEDPRTKEMMIGAFCRAFSVEQAIAEFLPTIYTKSAGYSQKPRYTYNGGTTSNGATIEDDGLFLFSRHSSDPCCQKLVNAFELIRMHKFLDLDKKTPVGTTTAFLPSTKATIVFVKDHRRVKKELGKSKYDVKEMQKEANSLIPWAEHPMFNKNRKDDAKTIKSVVESLDYNNQGEAKANLNNIVAILVKDPRLEGSIAFNQFNGMRVLRKDLKTSIDLLPDIIVRDRVNGDRWDNNKLISVRMLLDSPNGEGKTGWGMGCDKGILIDALDMAALNNQFHPVKDYLESLEWDGTDRIERLWIDYLGTPDTPYHIKTAYWLFIASVLRILNPGHKWDHMPMLISGQGVAKGQFIKELFGHEWTVVMTAGFDDQAKVVEQTAGFWGVEVAEGVSLNNKDTRKVKAMLTNTTDVVRKVYQLDSTLFYRQSVFIGTGNDMRFLDDDTGNRRFWPIYIKTKKIDQVKLKKNRDQLWAEAYHKTMLEAKAAGGLENVQAWLGEELEDGEAKKWQRKATRVSSSQENAIQLRAWLDREVPLAEIVPPEELGQRHEQTAVRCMFAPRQAGVEALELHKSKMVSSKGLDALVGAAIDHLDDWVPLETPSGDHARRNIGEYGHCRVYVRKDATPEEIKQGFRVINPPPKANPLTSTDDNTNPANFQ